MKLETRIRLLGQPCLLRPDGTALPLAPRRSLQLLARVACAEQAVPREELSLLFWPDREPKVARGNLRKVLHELRALGIEGLEEDAGGLRWSRATDLQAFHAACRAADWGRAAAAGRGRLLDGLDGADTSEAFCQWLALARAEHHARWRRAVQECLCTADAATAWDLAAQWLAADPLDDAAVEAALRAARAMQRPDLLPPLWDAHRARRAETPAQAPPAALAALAAGAPEAAPPWPLVGRSGERQALAERLSRGRLVTLLGPGGVGKTRLAQQAAQDLAPRFAQGAVFVSLGDLTTPAALPGRIADALGVSWPGHADPVEALARALAPRSILLVLDAFETVIDGAPAVAHWLARARGLHVLATSRERLELDGEWLLPLAALAPPAAGADPASLLANDAMRLFAGRASAMHPGFDLATCAEPVATICRQVEGLPLALELAASWTRLMPVADIAREIVANAGFLAVDEDSGGGLRAVFDRSWQLLTAEERRAFAQLSIFCGGFTREAALAVGQVTLPLLAALVDKSMLRAAGDGRFDMHLLLAQYAAGQLAARSGPAAAGAAEALAERHSRWYLSPLRPAPAELAVESANHLAAWRHAVRRGDAAAVEQALATLIWNQGAAGRLAEASALLDSAARSFGVDSVTGAHLRACQAWLLLWQERYAEASALAEGALARLEPARHPRGVVMALRTLGHAARRAGHHALSVARLERALAHADEAGLDELAGALRDAVAMALNMLGRFDEARVHLRAALATHEARGDDGQRMYNQFNLSQSHSLAGAPDLALPWSEAALDSALSVGHAIFTPYARVELALVQTGLGQLDAARAGAERALAEAGATGDRAAGAWAHEALARLALVDPGAAASVARRHVALAAAGCLATGNVAMGASLVPVAARAFQDADAERSARWLQALLVLDIVQQPTRREARALLAAAAGPAPTPVSLPALLAEIAQA